MLNYELVAGLEVHVELKTDTKIFCGCKNIFGARPNACCCPVCMGFPGAIPVLNKRVVEYAIKAGIALNCSISEVSYFARKNYFYPDLPKGYQITQGDIPICKNGYINIGDKKIGITRIHIEEDAGKLIHDKSGNTLIDCNRCGVPLIEIVSEPEIRSGEEAVVYLKKLRSIMLFSGISDCRMNEGSLRCDVNLSVRKKGTLELGTRCELKNLNSFQYIQKAIDFEFHRQVEILESGGDIIHETRRFDEKSGETYTMRAKETSQDYRYFPEPDLPPLVISITDIELFKKQLPVMPDDRKKKYVSDYGLSVFDAEMLTSDIIISDYFERCVCLTKYPKTLANLIITECFRLMEDYIPINPVHLAQCSDMVGDSVINSGTAKKLITKLWNEEFDPCTFVSENSLAQINDETILRKFVDESITENIKIINDFKKGKSSASKALMGKVMAKSKGLGNPEIVNNLVEEALLNL